jgi:hypothetical protein
LVRNSTQLIDKWKKSLLHKHFVDIEATAKESLKLWGYKSCDVTKQSSECQETVDFNWKLEN